MALKQYDTGLKKIYYEDVSEFPATDGEIRLGNNGEILWRNADNTDNIGLSLNDSNDLLFNGGIITTGSVPATRTISTVSPLSGGGDLSANRIITTSMATNKLIGRGTAGTGVMEEITLGTNLSLSGTTLNAGGSSTSTNFENIFLLMGG